MRTMRPSRTWALTTQRPPPLGPQVLVTPVSPGAAGGGGLRLALDDAGWGAAPAWVAEQRADGVPVELVNADAARRLAPGIAPACRGGVHCPMDGRADAMATVRAFATAARRLGARVEEGAAARRPPVGRGARAAGEAA